MSMTCTDIELILAQQDEILRDIRRVYCVVRQLDEKLDKLQAEFDAYQDASSGKEEELWEEEELSEDSEGSCSE